MNEEKDLRKEAPEVKKSEGKDLRKEKQQGKKSKDFAPSKVIIPNVPRIEGPIRDIIKVPCILMIICIFYTIAFMCGQKSERKEANDRIEAVEKEAFAKVEAANASVMAIVGEASVKIVTAQQEANSKVQLLESKLQEEYTEEEYTLLENFFDIVCRYRKGEKVFRYEMEDAVKMEKVIDELPYFSVLEEIDEKKILKYINTLKKVADKYPLASNVNQRIIDKLEEVEKEHKDKINSTATFKALDALKKQCADNIARWYSEKKK